MIAEMKSMNVYLIGMRGVGKSSTGQELALLLDRKFIDMDQELAAEFNQTITDFVGRQGWKAFRTREKTLLGRIATKRHCVVATGGGVVCDEQNIILMRRTGWLVWLTASVATLKTRIASDKKTPGMRPVIGKSRNASGELKRLMQERQTAYEKAMHVAIDTNGRRVTEICREIRDRYDLL